MSKFEKMEQGKHREIYWIGHQNKLIRYWIYALRGLQMINEFKYLIAGLISGYVILKLTNPMWMVVIGVACLPVLIVLGRWQLKKAQKVDQLVSTELGSVLKFNSYNIQVETLEILEEISKKLDKLLEAK